LPAPRQPRGPPQQFRPVKALHLRRAAQRMHINTRSPTPNRRKPLLGQPPLEYHGLPRPRNVRRRTRSPRGIPRCRRKLLTPYQGKVNSSSSGPCGNPYLLRNTGVDVPLNGPFRHLIGQVLAPKTRVNIVGALTLFKRFIQVVTTGTHAHEPPAVQSKRHAKA